MPELSEKEINSYLEWIEKNNPYYFLTINHDLAYHIENYSLKNVNRNYFKQELVKKFESFRLMRSPYWIRKGYTEELFKFKNS